MTKLQCSWPAPIDIEGLNKEDQDRIRKIGLHGWIEEVARKAVKLSRHSLEYKQLQSRKRNERKARRTKTANRSAEMS